MVLRLCVVLLLAVLFFSTRLLSVDVPEAKEEIPTEEPKDKPQSEAEIGPESKIKAVEKNEALPKIKSSPAEEKTALEFLNGRLDKYDQLLHFFWKNLGNEQSWKLNVEYRSKKTDEKKFAKDKVRIEGYVDLNQLKSMFRVSSRYAHLKAYSDSDQTLFVSRDTKQWCLHKSELKELAEAMRNTKTDKEAWDAGIKKVRERFFAVSGLSDLHLAKDLEKYEDEMCQVLSFNRGAGVEYRLYFLPNSGWLRGIKLNSSISADVSVMSNTQGYPAKFTAKIKNFTQGDNKYDFDISGTLNWKQGKFVDGKLILKTVFQELMDIELECELNLDDETALRENVFEPSFKRDSYQLKSFDDFKKELLNHAVGIFAGE